MKRRRTKRNLLIAGIGAITSSIFILWACGQAGSGDGSTSSGHTLLTGLTAVASVTTAYGGTCTKVTRDTSSCQSSRTLLGLSGDWLSFSCNVVLGLATSGFVPTTTYASATYVTVTAVGLPDHLSNYFPTSSSYSFTANGYSVSGTYSSMYESYTTTFQNPNKIAQKSYVLYIPISPTSATHAAMGMGVVGISVDGVPIYSGLAANTDNIYAEAGSFDQCQGHPDSASMYHYHSEPYGISYQDSNLIGVMRDGYFVYGRYDHGGNTDLDVSDDTTPSDEYKFGGHVGAAPTTGTGSRFHYHATKGYGCYHRSGATIYADDGNMTVDGSNPCTGPTAGGTTVTAYFLTGHGNGGTFASLPTATDNGGTMKNSTVAVRYYYGSAKGACTGC